MRRSLARRHYYPNSMLVNRHHKPVQFHWLPRRLMLVRHGESEANVDREVYSTTPDWRIPLTPRGRAQALDCGRRLRHIIGDEQLYMYYSPYLRTRQTLEEIHKSLAEEQIQGQREDERLREQEMGNYQPFDAMDATWEARNNFGRLYYRFPYGECGADVGDRVSSFFDSLLRERIGLTIPNMNQPLGHLEMGHEAASRQLGQWRGGAEPPSASHHHHRSSSSSNNNNSPADPSAPRAAAAEEEVEAAQPLDEAAARGVLPPNDLGATSADQNVVIVAHGLLIRLFIGRWFRVPMEVFETMLNPPNCSITVLERDDAAGRLVMSEKSRQLFGSDPLLQLMNFTGRESDALWYRERFLGIVDPDDLSSRVFHVEEDDDENHYYKSARHNSDVGAPQHFVQRRAQELQRHRARLMEKHAAEQQQRRQRAADVEAAAARQRAHELMTAGDDAVRPYGRTEVTEEKLRRWSKEF